MSAECEVPFGGLASTGGPRVSKMSTMKSLLGLKHFFLAMDAEIVETK